MFKDVFCFPGWREISGVCWKCLATPSTLKEFGKEAAWRQAPLTHWDVMSRILEKGNPINGFFQLLVLQKIAVIWTGYMQSIMEPRSMIQYFFIQIVQGLFLGLAFSKTQFFQGIVFFCLAFSKTKDKMFQTRCDPRLSGKFILVYIAQTGSYQKSSCSSPMARAETMV